VIYLGHPGKLDADSNPFEGYECQTEDKENTGASNPAAMQLYLKPGVTPEDMADIFDGLALICRHLGRLCDKDKQA
jgi:hypothetical protein